MNAKQCRMARAGLNWSGKFLAEKAGIRQATLSAFEKGGAALTTTVDKIKAVFIESGRVRFDGDDGIFVDDEK